MKNIYLRTILLFALALLLTNCTPEDGIDGINGINGIDGIAGVDGTDGENGSDDADFENGANGIDGENGADGVDGEDGVNGTDGGNGLGFDELTKYGSITMTLDGTRLDDVAFTDTAVFKFTPVNNYHTSSLVSTELSELEFTLLRFISAPDDVFQSSLLNLGLTVIDAGEETQAFEFDLGINQYAVISDDNKFFSVNQNFSEDGIGITNFVISNTVLMKQQTTLHFHSLLM